MTASPAGGPAGMAMRCFGGFRIELDGRPVDLSAVRGRARAMLRLLAIRAGRPVQRAVLTEALWSGLSPAAAAHDLTVCVANLRELLQPVGTVARTGDAYALSLPAGCRNDTLALEAAVQHWGSAARRGGDAAGGAAGALREALAAYRGDLLPEDGPAEWVVDERERYRRLAALAASALAGFELVAGNRADAVAAAEQCVAIDPYHDTGWRQLTRAYETCGQLAAAAAARRRYAGVLASLGMAVPR